MSNSLKGLAKIELTNVHTGKTITHYEHNMVTNALNNVYGNNPFGAILYNISPASFLGGIALFNESITEDVDNTQIPCLPSAWAGNNQSSGSSIYRGSLIDSQTSYGDDGVKYVWEWNTSQGNGTYKSLGLVSGKQFGNDNLFDMEYPDSQSYNNNYDRGLFYNSQLHNFRLDSESSKLTDDIYKQCTSACPDYIDSVNGYFYKFDLLDDGVTLHVVRIKLDMNTLNINGGHFKNNLNLNSKYGVVGAGYEYTDITLPIKCRNSTRDVHSVEEYNGKIYIFYGAYNTGNLTIFKINSSELFNNPSVEYSTVSYNNISIIGANYGTGIFDTNHARLGSLKKGKVPFSYPYIYLPAGKSSSKARFVKCNINDSSDMTIIDGNINDYSLGNYEFGGYAKIGNFIRSANGVTIDIANNKLYKDSMAYYFDGYYYSESTIYPICNGAYIYCNGKIVSNTLFLATINNVTQFTKTSSDTMKITYTLTNA